MANEVRLGKDIQDVEDGGLGGEVGVRAGGTAVLPDTPGEVSAMPTVRWAPRAGSLLQAAWLMTTGW